MLYDLPLTLQTLLCIMILAENILLVFSVFSSYLKRNAKVQMIPGLLIIMITEYLHILMRNDIHAEYEGLPMECGLIRLWQVYALMIMIAAVSFLILLQSYLWSRNHFNAETIKESIDTLPAGICCYGTSGKMYLVNKLMSELAYEIMGMPLRSGTLFYESISSGKLGNRCMVIQTGETPVIETADGRVYSFILRKLKSGNLSYLELTASDITVQYEKAKQLYAKKIQLQSVNQRLKDYSEQVGIIAREQEQISARKQIHDQMNVILLKTRHIIEDGIYGAERQEIADLWKKHLLLAGENLDDREYDSIGELKEAADSIGLKLQFSGTLPKKKEHIHIFMVAVSECMINAAKHAHAESVFVEAGENYVKISNDGSLPDGEITEGGGLGFVRADVEASGGMMTVYSDHSFHVLICYER